MKKIIITTALLISTLSFAQKDELKTIRKILEKDSYSEYDMESFYSSANSLQSYTSDEGVKLYAKYFKNLHPFLNLYTKGKTATLEEQMRLFKPEYIKDFITFSDETIAYEEKIGKNVFASDIKLKKDQLKQKLKVYAFALNDAKKFNEGALAFYNLYAIDPKNNGKSLQNAAILAVQGQDYKLSEKLYEEFYNSEYFQNGTVYLAVNKTTGIEEDLEDKETQKKYIALGLYEKPRDKKVKETKAEIIKLLSILYSQNGDIVKAKKMYAEARELSPDDEELKNGEFSIYYNEGFALLANETKLVDEINANVANKKKYDELIAARVQMFKNSIPSFEKAYSIIPTDENTKNILKTAYEVTGQIEKAKGIQ